MANLLHLKIEKILLRDKLICLGTLKRKMFLIILKFVFSFTFLNFVHSCNASRFVNCTTKPINLKRESAKLNILVDALHIALRIAPRNSISFKGGNATACMRVQYIFFLIFSLIRYLSYFSPIAQLNENQHLKVAGIKK